MHVLNFARIIMFDKWLYVYFIVLVTCVKDSCVNNLISSRNPPKNLNKFPDKGDAGRGIYNHFKELQDIA